METNKPNDTAKELEQIKRERLRAAAMKAGKIKGEQKEEPKLEEQPEVPSEENVPKEKTPKESEKNLDNNQKNDYIVGDEDEVKIQNIIDKNFDGDINKLGKSYLDSQREFTRLYNQSKEKDKFINTLENVLQKNPKLKELINKAQQGEDVESYLNGARQEPNGKPNQSEPDKSKLDTNTVDEATLIEAGVLDATFLDNLSEVERQAVVRRARLDYLENKLPDNIAQKAIEKYEAQIGELEKQRKEKEQREKNTEIIIERYENGIAKVVENFNLDFANNEEHRQLLDEIDKRVNYLRDHNNPNVIRVDAVEIATKEVLSEKGMLKDSGKPTPPNREEPIPPTGFNANKRQAREKKATTIREKLQERRIQNYKKSLESGIPQRKEKVITINR